MATGTINLHTMGAVTPDGSANNAAPQSVRVKSSASAPSLHFVEWLFDQSTDEHLYWGWFEWPADYASSPVAKIKWKANATSGSCVWVVRIAAITAGDAETPNEKALASANSVTTACNATEARRAVESSVALTNDDSVAAGDQVLVCLHRDADNGSDNLAVDAELTSFAILYTTT